MILRLTWRRVLLAIGGLAVAGLLAMWSGVIPITASSGHWEITNWVLHTAMRSSVRTYSLGITAPDDLDNPALVHRGAGHFAMGCEPCHGAPGLPRTAFAQAMTPEPPSLEGRVPTWTDEELFRIVMHGVKFTGMPAWPSLVREDEVWAMVAFLRQFPELTPAAYADLAQGPAADPPPRAEIPEALPNCVRCHDYDGSGRGVGAFPDLRRQTPAYIAATLSAYANGTRASGIMQTAAAQLDTDDIEALAQWYGRADAPAIDQGTVEPGAIEDERIARGARIALNGVPGEGVAVCASCHGPFADPALKRRALFPDLAGLPEDWLLEQLKLWKEGVRGGTFLAHIMATVAGRLDEEQMRDLAAYYAAGAPMPADAAAP